MPTQLRQIVDYIYVFRPSKDPRSLWSKFLLAFTKDYVKKGYKDSGESLAMRKMGKTIKISI
jgi:hypothetical protein